MSRLPFQHFIPVWKPAPILRYLLPLIVGLIVARYAAISILMASIVSSCFVLLFAVTYFSKYRTRVWFGITTSLVFMAMGFWLFFLHDKSGWNDFAGKHYQPGYSVIATLKEPLVEKPNSYKAEAAIEILSDQHTTKKVTGNIIIYIQKDSLRPTLEYGSRIIFNKTLQPIKNAGNPGGFDYKQYAAYQGIYYQVFLKVDEYLVQKGFYGSVIQRSIYATRDWMLEVFKKYIPGKAEAGLAEALLAGYKDDLDKDLVEQYASTGVVHIIAISGMHLAIIYAGLVLLLKPIGKRKYGKLFTAIVIIFALWFFSFLTGAAPSITRSALMFTVIVIGNNINRKIEGYNSLSLAAFMLLIINPFNLWNVGFQLSFAALLSIFTFGKAISNWWSFNNWMLQKTWQLLAVTLAAQVLTLPIVIYDFHQFPVYFLLANLLAIPLSTIILYGLLLLLAVSFIAPVAKLVGWVLHYGIWVMNALIGWIAGLPGVTFDQIQFSIWHTLVLIIIIIGFSWWLFHKHAAGLGTALSGIAVLCILLWWQYFQTLNQRKLIVYNVPQHLAVDIVEGRKYHFIGDTVLQQKGFLQNFNLLPARILYQTREGENLEIPANDFGFYQLNKTSLLILDKEPDNYNSDTVKTDLLLISKNKRLYPNRVLKKIQCHTIILDGSVGGWLQQQWKNAADSLHLRLHFTGEQGAFVMNY
jgi:competence protein ComEC